MNIPPSGDPIWQDIVTGKVKYEFEYFAIQLLQGSLARALCDDPSPANLCKCCETLRELFVRNAEQPLVQKDINILTTKRGR